jgi:hypothetical protein
MRADMRHPLELLEFMNEKIIIESEWKTQASRVDPYNFLLQILITTAEFDDFIFMHAAICDSNIHARL